MQGLVSSSGALHDSSAVAEQHAATEHDDLGPSTENSADKRHAGHVQLAVAEQQHAVCEQQTATEHDDLGPSTESFADVQPATRADGGNGVDISGPEVASDEQGLLQMDYYLQRLGRLGAEVTFLVAALVLGSFGSFMSRLSLSFSWAMLLVKLLMDFSIRPSWMWLTSYLSTRRSTVTAELCPACPQSGLHISAADRYKGEFSVAIVKIVLAVVLLIAVKHPGLSAGCSNPPCSHRAKESMRGLALMVIVLEGVPLLLSWAVQARVVGVGFQMRVKRSYHLLRHAVHEFRRDDNLTWWQFALILQSFQASASSAVLVSTAGLLVGGNFGSFMTGKCFWFCLLVVVVELLAEGACPVAIEIFRYYRPLVVHPSPTITEQKQQNEEQENTQLEELIAKRGLSEVNRQLKEEAIAKLLLRVPIHAIICRFLIKIVRQEASIYPPGLVDDNSCDPTCKANTRALLTVLCIFSGSQVLSIFPLWAPLQILAALLPGFLMFGLFYILVGALPLMIFYFLVMETSLIATKPPYYPALLETVMIPAMMVLVYGIMYMMFSWKRRWLSPKLHYTLLTPMVTVGAITAYSTFSYIPGLVTITLLVIVYLMLLYRGFRQHRKTSGPLPLVEGDK